MRSEVVRLYEEVVKSAQQVRYLGASLGLLAWDQETYMPKGSVQRRAKQVATLSALIHKINVEELYPKVEQLIDKDLGDEIKNRNIRMLYRALSKQVKLPESFVVTFARTTTEAQCAWEKAKKENNFPLFAPYLEKIVELNREKAEIYGYEDTPYDALLDLFEPDARSRQLDKLFAELKIEIKSLFEAIQQSEQIDDSFLYRYYDKQKQMLFCTHLAKNLQFDLEQGRIDTSVHPFTMGIAPEDVRITTRINEEDITMSVFSTVHEVGHALYEQGLNREHFGLPIAEPCSLGIHESQSRLWENNIARSKAFWEFYFPILHSYFPEVLNDITPEQMYRAVNKVIPNLIRISSDELTYHFHIILRYELERALIEGELKVKELPEAWNAKVKEYLGLDVPSDSQGVLQDIHWSHGTIGYFPTYSLGSFYAAQFLHYASLELGDLDDYIREGNFAPIHQWLKENVYRYGALYTPEELCVKICGEPLNVRYFLQYISKKLSDVYQLTFHY